MNAIVKEFLLKAVAFLCPNQVGKVVFYHDAHDRKKYAKTSTPLQLLASHIKIGKDNGFSFPQGLPFNKKEVMICFDDGYRGVYDCKEYFQKNDIRPTIFLAVDLIGQEGYLSWDEIKELQQYGFVFQSHTCSHRTLTEVPEPELAHELKDSKSIIEDKLGNEVNWLCFPRGRFTRHICQTAYGFGYDKLFSSIPGNALDSRADGLICRNIVQSLSPAAFLATLNGGANLFYNRYYKLHCMSSNT